MKKQDLFFIGFLILLFLPFVIFEPVYSVYEKFNAGHGFITSFIKFQYLPHQENFWVYASEQVII